MVFSSLLFIFLFLPITLLMYYGAKDKWKNIVLFIMSLLFYAWGEPVYILLMIFSTIVDYTHGMKVEENLNKGNRKKAFRYVISSAIINLSLLGFFKYADFIVSNVNIVFNTNIPLLHLPLPIGISFYTFQTMSYTIDIYRGDAKAQKSVIVFGTYVALFPQLVAGPIVRYQTVADQINKRTHSEEKFADGVNRFCIGLGKKVILSNQLAVVADGVFNAAIGNISVLESWLGIICYTLQIYFDFSGYSDMAIGLGKMFGFDFLENFNYPYISKSISEFWRRWHISLGSWFRDYVYIPLGGSRVSKLKIYRNIFVVWFLTGMWHGAEWTFVIWGLLYGLIIAMERAFLNKWLEKRSNIFRHVYVLATVTLLFVIFRSLTIGDAIEFYKVMFGLSNNPIASNQLYIYIIDYWYVIIAAMILSTPVVKIAKEYINSKINVNESKSLQILYGLSLCMCVLVSTIMLCSSTYNPFLYFRF